MWNVLSKDVIHIVTTVLSSSVSYAYLRFPAEHASFCVWTLRNPSFVVITVTKIAVDITLVQCSHFGLC